MMCIWFHVVVAEVVVVVVVVANSQITIHNALMRLPAIVTLAVYIIGLCRIPSKQ